jgi:cation diffusion facilitator CzcD-associated flavoprotein CzcO
VLTAFDSIDGINGKWVKFITDWGMIVDDVEFDLVAIMLGTGYSLGGSADRGSIAISGRGSKTLQQKWQSGLASFQGVSLKGFPNLFFPGPY